MKLINLFAGSKSSGVKESKNPSAFVLQDFEASLCRNDQNPQFCAADHLLEIKEYSACITAYQKLIRLYPEKRYYCEVKIADAYKWLGDSKKAIEFLMAARVHGANEEEIDDNIWELCEEIYYQNRNAKGTEAIEKYLTLFPKGKHISKARKLLS
jgi:tetratricopeptide (TPR) repeat protein